ncbi:MAG TPA: APC family permease [Streptosporangiaceae bacterium]|jgi:amino acid transporter|nr:APC family permease [Streptosporangiaceae bacterium]
MSQDLSDVPPRLRRDIGLLPLFMVSAGSVIGSGWLLGTLNASEAAGPAALISWIIGVVLLIGIALIYAELGSTYPISGSTARFTWIHAGTLGGFFAGTYSYLQAMAVAPIEVEATLSYVDAKVWHGLVNSTTGLLTGKGLAVAIAMMFLFTALNLFGIKWMARTNSVAMVWKILVPFMTVIFLMAKAFHTSNFTAVGGFMPFGIKGVFIAIPLGIVFALEGFEQAAQLAGEARNPRRDVPIAVVGSMLLGAALYILLQLCFTGALNPATLAHGTWKNPFGTPGHFGPYYTLAESVGLGWLGVILIIDAIVSPAGTGLVYVSAASRLSYSLGKTRFVPPVFASIDRRGVPWFSIIFGGAFGCILFLPFGSWSTLVGAITAASSFMYSFAPVAAVSLRRSDPERQRPYRAPMLNIIAPFSFVVSGFIIYWSGTANDLKIDAAVVFFLVLYVLARRLDPNQEPLDFRAGSFAIPWIIGLTIFSIFGGSYVGGISSGPGNTGSPGGYDTFLGAKIGVHLPFWWDLGAIAIFSLIVFYYGVNSRLGPERTIAHAEEAAADAHSEDLDLGVGHPA